MFSFILIFIGKPDNFILSKTSGVVADVMSPFIKIISYPIYITHYPLIYVHQAYAINYKYKNRYIVRIEKIL